MTDEAKALVERLREVGVLSSYDPISADTCVHSALHEAADLIETQAAEILALKARDIGWSMQCAEQAAEIERLRTALHEIDIEAANTIPPDGKDAAFAALFRIAQIINPFRLPRAALAGDSK